MKINSTQHIAIADARSARTPAIANRHPQFEPLTNHMKRKESIQEKMFLEISDDSLFEKAGAFGI